MMLDQIKLIIPVGCASSRTTAMSRTSIKTTMSCTTRKTAINSRAGGCSGIRVDVRGTGLSRFVFRGRGGFGKSRRDFSLPTAQSRSKTTVNYLTLSDCRKRTSSRPTGPAVRVQHRSDNRD